MLTSEKRLKLQLKQDPQMQRIAKIPGLGLPTPTAAVATIGGVQTVSLQLVEQSPINLDELVLGALADDYAQRIDLFVINNNATNKRGLLNVSGVNAVTYTDATPTVPEVCRSWSTPPVRSTRRASSPLVRST